MNMETNSHTTSPYIQLIEQIEVLQQEAKRLREQEIQSVIESIQKQITYYNITLQELGYTNVPDDANLDGLSTFLHILPSYLLS